MIRFFRPQKYQISSNHKSTFIFFHNPHRHLFATGIALHNPISFFPLSIRFPVLGMVAQEPHDDAHLVLGMFLRGKAVDAHLVDAAIAHLKVFRNLVVLAPRQETQLVIAVVQGHSVRVELVVVFAHHAQHATDAQLLKSLRTVPIAETRNVGRQQMSLFHLIHFGLSFMNAAKIERVFDNFRHKNDFFANIFLFILFVYLFISP